MSDSTAYGFIAETSADAYDAALDAILQAAVVGIAALSGTLVRPRWQPNVPNMPEPDQSWCAIGVNRFKVDDNAYDRHREVSGVGENVLERDEELTALASFYGPSSAALAHRFSDGLKLSQNRAAMQSAGLYVITVGDPTPAPKLVANIWVRRVDVSLELRRRTQRVYPVRTIVEVPGTSTLNNENYITPLKVNQ